VRTGRPGRETLTERPCTMRLYWLSTLTSIRCCGSLAQAAAIAEPGQYLYRHDPESGQAAAFPSYVVTESRTGRKTARKLVGPSTSMVAR
jgi:hypothetical protein